MKDVIIHSNKDLEGKLWLNQNSEKGIVVVHSFRNDFQESICFEASKEFAKQGYNVLTINLIGHGNSKGSLRDIYKMTEDIKKWWNDNAKEYQDESNIAIDIYYGPGAPNEDKLNLIGNVEGKNVLEIGCGAAHCGIAFAKKGANVTGIDISEEQLKMAKELIKKNKVEMELYEGDITNLNRVESDTQDIVFTAWALQYVEDLQTCFKEVYRVLKKGGIFVLSLDHPFWRRIGKESRRIKKSYFEKGRYEEPHKKGIFVAYDKSISDIINALADAGFKIEKMLEPDSSKKNVGDYWYDNQEGHRKEAMKWVPRTIIFKAKKI